MRMRLYRAVQRLRFKGSARVQEWFRRLCFPHPVVSGHAGLRFEVDPWEWTQIELVKSGRLEPLTTALYEQLLRPGDVCVDVGAHVGFHAMLAARLVGPAGRVVAIEPQPYNCDRILTNCRLNEIENVLVIVAAAGETDQRVLLNNQDVRDKSRLSLQLGPVNDTPQQFEVPMVRLDQVAERHGLDRIRLLKLDVEGLELQVLRGAGAALLDRVDHVVLEVLPEEQLAESRGQIAELLREAGYELFTVEGAAWAGSEPLAESNLWARR